MEGMRYITSTSSNDGTSTITITFEPTRDIEVAAVDVQNRVSRAAARLPAQVNQTGHRGEQGLQPAADEHGPVQPGQPLRREVPLQLRRREPARTRIKRVQRRGRGAHLRRAQVLHARCGSIPPSWRAASSPPQDVVRALQEQNLQVAAGQVGQPPSSDDAALPDRGARAGAGWSSRRSSTTSSSSAARTGGWCACKDVGRAELGAENYGQLLRFNGRTGVGIGIFQLPTANALDVRDARARRRWSGCRSSSRRAWSTGRPRTPRSRCAPRSTRWCTRWPRPSRWSSWSSSCSCTAGAACSSPRSPCRCRWSAPSRS